ncbi:phage tail assembly chaperone [Agrilactobacillus fermenti]|uniref:phage tail assembly chaperone n=1 Tax=Agrilactobacillus fermenti TaxID=2586909 RepID=UPI003A5BE0E6
MAISINDFLAENVDSKPETREVKFPRFKSPFVIQSVTAEQNETFQRNATRKVRDKLTRQITTELDQNKYVDMLVTASVITPDLNNEQLQKSWNSLADPAGVLKKMLRAGEYGDLTNEIQDLSGFDAEDVNQLSDEVKN